MPHDRLSLSYARAVAADTTQQLQAVGLVSHRGEGGRAREEILRTYLRRILPSGLGVSTGFVVDGVGGTSRQVDVIVHRRHYHPVFTIGGVEHHMIESVIAVFEIKARLESRVQLQDTLANVQTVKALDRTGGGSNYALPFQPPRGKLIDPDVYPCQVFGGVITEVSPSLDLSLAVLQAHLHGRPRREWPNIFVALDKSAIRYREPGGRISEDPMHATSIAASNPNAEDSEPPLVDLSIALANITRVSVTVDYNPSNYFRSSDTDAANVVSRTTTSQAERTCHSHYRPEV